jgi:3',5'-cyclic-nucleotide phosphodiesterase
MKLRVLGCHGGTSDRHRNVSCLVDDHIAIDAGSLAAGLSVAEQIAVDAVLVSHSHMDHVADLGVMADVSQMAGTQLSILSIPETIAALRTHFFNNVLWPDFTVIPTAESPTLELRELAPEELTLVGELHVRPIPVHHSVPSCGYLIERDGTTLAYTGDTGPTERFWEVAADVPGLAAVITELSYPSRMAELAHISGHLTPELFEGQMERLDRPDVPILLYGMKPLFEAEILAELHRFDGRNVRALVADEVIEL